MSINYTPVKSMYIRTSEAGTLIEGRQARKGYGSMKISSYTKDWELYGIKPMTIQVPEIPMPITEISYYVRIKTFLPLSTLGEVKRFDSLSSWLLTYQENLRHLGSARKFVEGDIWNTMVALVDSYFEEIVDVFTQWLDYVILKGDCSFEQWRLYVHDHKDSADPFGVGKWADIENDEGMLKLSWQKTLTWMKEFRSEFTGLCKQGQELFLRANLTYAGMRARPGEAQILSHNDYELLVFIKKWRDRKVGGIRGLSQLGFSIYKNKHHKAADAIFHRYFKKLLNIDCISISEIGPQAYLDLMNERDIYLYDIKTAEKQVGLLFHEFPFVADLGHPSFEAKFAAEMYSGIAPTTPLNEFYQAIFLKALQQLGLWNGKKWYFFSDNMALDKPLPDQPYVDAAETFCGLIQKEKRFGPISLCTDNPSHRLLFKGDKQVQFQRVQYIMRPFMAVVMNSLDKMDSAYKFMQYVVDNKLIDEADSYEGVRQDVIKDIILSKDKTVHSKILDAFANSAQWVRDNFIVQETDALRPTDLVVH